MKIKITMHDAGSAGWHTRAPHMDLESMGGRLR